MNRLQDFLRIMKNGNILIALDLSVSAFQQKYRVSTSKTTSKIYQHHFKKWNSLQNSHSWFNNLKMGPGWSCKASIQPNYLPLENVIWVSQNGLNIYEPAEFKPTTSG